MPIASTKPPSNPGIWKSRQDTGKYKILSEKLHGGLPYSNILLKLLANRGFDSQEKVESFLNPSLKNLHEPAMLPNMDSAVKRLMRAMRRGERVLVFGDYDADGIVSTAILYNFLKKIGANVSAHIPSRFESGYDINIDFIKKKNTEKSCDLIICVDCGTNALSVIRYVKYCPENAIDVIVCDHHEVVVAGEADDAGKETGFGCNNEGDIDNTYTTVRTNDNRNCNSYTIINPKLPGSEYPFKFLSGAGVTFKFIMAILRNLGTTEKEKISSDYLNSILDLVAVSTVADLMPLTGENRIIVKEGLKRLKNSTNPGLNMLINRIIGDKDEFNTYDIGFVISPRLNASGRMSTADSSLRLLLDNTDMDEGVFKMEISSIIDELEKSNSSRKEIQQKTVKEILDNYDFYGIASTEKIFIAKSDSWSIGVLGIAASEIVKKFNIPVILFIEAGGILKGSGRSIEKFDLYDNLGNLSHYFKKYGGHKQACGITMELKNYEDFKSSMIELATKMLTEKDLEKVYYFDAEIVFSEINFKLTSDISRLEPFGEGNAKPVFQTRCCQITGEPRLLKDGRHMVVKLKNSSREFEAIIFNCGDLYPDFTNYIIKNRKDKTLMALLQLDILYNIELKKSPYDENRLIQLCIQSLKVEPDLIKITNTI
jgi:single-stranded-DNA-specific exonuclease